MPFNINNFIVNMGRDGARPNLFDITFGIPNGITGFTAPDVTLKAKASALPSSTIGVARTFYFGREAKFAGNRTFGEWSVSLLLDEQDFTNGSRAFLEQWSNQINYHVENVRGSAMVAPPNYMMDGTVRQYSKDNTSIIAEYKMVGCFPVDIGAIPVSWDANDQIMEFSVTFAMQWWERIGITTTTGGI